MSASEVDFEEEILYNQPSSTTIVDISPHVSAKRKRGNSFEVKKRKHNSGDSKHKHNYENIKNGGSTCENSDEFAEILHRLDEDIDSLLQKTAERNNLTTINVKNILKHVITNDHVLAMVRNTMKPDDADVDELEEAFYEPKLTRSKAKELREKQYKLPWPVSTPAKKAELASKQLLEEEFSESSSDEDYHPNEEECRSEEEDIPSSPKSSATGASLLIVSPEMKPDEEDENQLVIDLPNMDTPKDSTEADKIALRTRSKLCLNDTPLEAIEASFIAPDITIDMYNTECDNEDWQNFLSELTKPLDLETKVEHAEEEDDPEYNILEDDDIPDDWDLRNDKAVKISKKEVNALMAEILEYAEHDLNEEEEEETPRENLEPISLPVVPATAPQPSTVLVYKIGTPVLNDIVLHKAEACWITPTDRVQLEEQMRMHVQLLTQSFLLSYGVKELIFIHESSRIFLEELEMFASREMITSRSAFGAHNLHGAMDIMKQYNNPTSCINIRNKTRESKGIPTIHSVQIKKTLLSSPVFIYPELLPHGSFHKIKLQKQKPIFIRPEDNLLAIGLEEFSFSRDCLFFIQNLLLPTKTVQQLKFRMKNCNVPKVSTENPVKYYLVNRQAPPIPKIVRIFNPKHVKAPKEYPPQVLPKWMRPYVEHPPVPAASTTPISTPRILRSTVAISPTVHQEKPNEPPPKQSPPRLRNHLLRRRPLKFNKNRSIHCGSWWRKKSTWPRLKAVVGNNFLKQRAPVTSHLDESESDEVDTPPNVDSSCVIEPHSETADDEQDLADLMTASSTIRKVTRRPLRDLDSSLALLHPSLNEPKKNEKEFLFANSYLLRVTNTLRDDPDTFDNFLRTLCRYQHRTKSPLKLYDELKEILRDYPELTDDFVAFLTPDQASGCGKSLEYSVLRKIRKFLCKLELHFWDQPQHLVQILKAFSQLRTRKKLFVMSKDIFNTLQPLLENEGQLLEELSQIINDTKVVK